jgi:hypothetical protein
LFRFPKNATPRECFLVALVKSKQDFVHKLLFDAGGTLNGVALIILSFQRFGP